ncbi:unnamed protein product [Dracunculus medinensis]|uniref:Uncharacterized protein n=1 Tax=Dracunculus medinensis TaxID=318479 RepID=A0A0N4U8T3_DRAME|nr:unnamed protein product [Dracunculus medinensis]
MGENLEQFSIEIIIENKLSTWILDRIYRQWEEQEMWSEIKTILNETDSKKEVTRSQHHEAAKGEINPRYFPEETLALTITTPQIYNYKTKVNNTKKVNKTQRPCIFCNKNHWDNECQTYSSLEQKMQQLKENNACLNCLQPGYGNQLQKKKKYLFPLQRSS